MRIPFLLFSLLLCAAGASASADAADDADCGARADAVVARMRADAAAPLSEREAELARSAALAGCESERDEPKPTSEPKPVANAKPADAKTEAEPSAAERFWAGVFSFENKGVKKRAGKYRYVEDD